MNLMTKLLAAGAVALGLSGATAAMAADARTTTNLNIRVGPGVEYGYIDTIPAGALVPVFGCIGDFGWCEVSYAGIRGWVSSDYLMAPGYGYYNAYAPQIGVPVVTFSFGAYHDRWYKGRPWYKHDRWSGRWDNRYKKDARKDWRDDRKDWQKPKKDWKQDHRDAKKDWKKDRREIKQHDVRSFRSTGSNQPQFEPRKEKRR